MAASICYVPVMSKLSPGKEFERRFLLRAAEFPDALKRCRKRIVQGYLAVAPTQVRVRIIDDSDAVMDVKGRDEFEMDPPVALDLKRARRLLESDVRVGALVEKDRYEVPSAFGGLIWEVDVFLGENAPLAVVEIETPTKAYRLDRALFPPWVGQEITGDRSLEPYLKNRALALRPFARLPERRRRRILRLMSE